MVWRGIGRRRRGVTVGARRVDSTKVDEGVEPSIWATAGESVSTVTADAAGCIGGSGAGDGLARDVDGAVGEEETATLDVSTVGASWTATVTAAPPPVELGAL